MYLCVWAKRTPYLWNFTVSVGIPVAHFVEKLNACAVNPEGTGNQLKAGAILL